MELPSGEAVLSPCPYHYAFLLHSPEALSPQSSTLLEEVAASVLVWGRLPFLLWPGASGYPTSAPTK